MTRLRPFATIFLRILLLAWLAVCAPAAGLAQDRRNDQAAAEPMKAKQHLCPQRWGKRPKRAGGPGAELYVAEWGPCKPGETAPTTLSGFVPRVMTTR